MLATAVLAAFFSLSAAQSISPVSNVQNGPGSVLPRWNQALVEMSGAAVFIGGRSLNGLVPSGESVLILDTSKPFALSNMPWTLPAISGDAGAGMEQAVAFRVPGKLGILVNGGVPSVADASAVSSTSLLTLSQDGRSASWMAGNAADDGPAPRRLGHAMTTLGSQAYLFGGAALRGAAGSAQLFNDLWSYDMNGLAWRSLNGTQSAPEARQGHTLTAIVNSGLLVLLGGSMQTGLASMTDVWTFSVADSRWTRHSATGTAPASRQGHSASVIDGNKLVVYGGANADESASYDDVHVLSTSDWSWSKPQLNGAVKGSGRRGHATATIGNVLLIAFGYDASQRKPAEPMVQLLDTKTWTFVDATLTASDDSGAKSGWESTKSIIIICALVASALVLACVTAAVVIVRNRRKRHRSQREFDPAVTLVGDEGIGPAGPARIRKDPSLGLKAPQPSFLSRISNAGFVWFDR